MKNIGIFSGSFNPIHIGHLALANWLCEYEKLDEVWFLVTPQNPLKAKDNLLDDRLRYKMVETAIGDYPKFKASDLEFALPKPSYSINTFRTLQKSFPDCNFSLIIGADNWNVIHNWKEHEALLSEFDVFVYPREGYTIEILSRYNRVCKVNAPIIEISSTFIRQALKEEKDIRFFLSESIRSFIPVIKKQL